MRKITAGLLMCVALAGCSSAASTTHSAGPQLTAIAQDPNAIPGLTLQSDPSIVNARPIAVQSWSKVGADRIAVHFETGSPVCYGIDAITSETSSTVDVLLKSGVKPGAQGKICPMVAMMASLDITLKSPLGNRKVVSGS